MSHVLRRSAIAAVGALALGSGAAAAQAADSVVHSTSTSVSSGRPSTTAEAWTDEATGDTLAVHRDAQGNRTSASRIDYGAPGERPAIRWISYTARTWFDVAAPVAPIVPETDTALVSRLRATGRLEVVGRDVLGGRPVTVLRSTHGGQIDERYWVDEATGRPLQEQERSLHMVTTRRFEYLPSTAANLALVRLTVPDGFTALAAPPASRAAPARSVAARRRAATR